MIIKLDMSLINRKIAIIYNGQYFCPQVVIYTSNTIHYLSSQIEAEQFSQWICTAMDILRSAT